VGIRQRAANPPRLDRGLLRGAARRATSPVTRGIPDMVELERLVALGAASVRLVQRSEHAWDSGPKRALCPERAPTPRGTCGTWVDPERGQSTGSGGAVNPVPTGDGGQDPPHLVFLLKIREEIERAALGLLRERLDGTVHTDNREYLHRIARTAMRRYDPECDIRGYTDDVAHLVNEVWFDVGSQTQEGANRDWRQIALHTRHARYQMGLVEGPLSVYRGAWGHSVDYINWVLRGGSAVGAGFTMRSPLSAAIAVARSRWFRYALLGGVVALCVALRNVNVRAITSVVQLGPSLRQSRGVLWYPLRRA